VLFTGRAFLDLHSDSDVGSGDRIV
jgi:hypothetical protein